MAWISENYGFEYNSEVSYQKVSINQLSSDLCQSIIFGIVIAKQDIRRISSRKHPGSERFVFNFTLRDSPNDTINAACWGDENSISTLSTSFSIGDVVKIKNPQIIERQSETLDEKFKPKVTSHYQLNISPLYSEITVCQGDEKKSYEKLLHCTTRVISEIVNLADVVFNSQTAEGLTVNLLVALREIGTLQTVKTKDGREVKKFQLLVFDQSHSMFTVMIWEEETSNFIIKYCSKRSVLLISDVKVNYNSFMKEMVATSGSMTIFTPDPDIADARVLYQYAMKATLPVDKLQNSNANDMSTIYTLEQIIKLINSVDMMMDEMQGTTNAILSAFDIDGSSKISSFRCSGCMQQLQNLNEKCKNDVCEVGSGEKSIAAEEIYDIMVTLSDHSGSIEKCHLTGQAARKMLGINVQDFHQLSEDDKTNLKWMYLFERFTIQFKASQSAIGIGKYIFRILSCDKME